MSFYGDMQALAQDLLTEFDQGGLALAVFTAGGTPHSPTVTYPETAFTGTVRGVTAEDMKDSLVQSSDLIVTMPGGGLVPKGSDRVKIGGKLHSIVKIEPKPATGTVAAYLLVCRK